MQVLCSQCSARFISPPPPRCRSGCRLSACAGYFECVGCADSGARGGGGLSVNTGMLKAFQKSQWLAQSQSQPPLTSHTHIAQLPDVCINIVPRSLAHGQIQSWSHTMISPNTGQPCLLANLQTDKILHGVSATLATHMPFIASPAPTPYG